jgi:voltage-gated potassium channel
VTRSPTNPRARAALLLLLLVLTVGTVGYLLLGLTALEALYQTAITVTTVGFGEIGPAGEPSANYRLFTLALVLAGTGSVVFAAGVMVETMIESRLGMFQGRRMQREIDKMSGHVIIAGYGRVGAAVVRRAAGLGGDLVVIDQNEDAIRDCGHPHITGDASADETLRGAGVDRARSVVAALPSDAANLFLAVSARQLNPDIRVVSRANAADAAHKLRSIALDTVVEPYEMAGARLATAALRPHTSDYLDQVFSTESDKVELTEVEIHPDSLFVGQPVGAPEEQCGIVVVAIRSGGDRDFTGAAAHHEPLAIGDVLIALGDREGIEALMERAL